MAVLIMATAIAIGIADADATGVNAPHWAVRAGTTGGPGSFSIFT
jgi:hypothetical protein